MSKCARPGCLNAGTKTCSVDLIEQYCCVDCQKLDWKSHKLICKSLKKLTHQLLPYDEVEQVIGEMLKPANHNNRRLLEHLLSYSEFQFGDRIPLRTYRERGDGQRLENWNVEIENLVPILTLLIVIFIEDESLSEQDRDSKSFLLFEKMTDILRPWSAYVDVGASTEIVTLDKGQINYIRSLMSDNERELARICTGRNQFNTAENHCQKALLYARLYEDEGDLKTGLLCHSLITYSDLRKMQGNLEEGVNFAEEAYNCVAIAYNPVHPKVQSTAAILIELLIRKGDFSKAEIFAQMTLDSLRNPMNEVNQESEEVARGYCDLASALHGDDENEDLIRAETLVRESLRIRVLIFGNDHICTGHSISLLAQIMSSEGKLGDETKSMYERALANYIRNQGPDALNTSITSSNLGNFHYKLSRTNTCAERKKELLGLSKAYYTEAVRILTKIFGIAHPRSTEFVHRLSDISRELSEV